MSVISFWQIRQFVSFKIVIDREWIKKLLSFSIPLIPYSVTSFFCTNYLDAFFITKYLTKSELGIYSVGYQINSLVLQFLVLVGTLLMPMFVTLRTKGHDKFIKQYLDVILPFFVLIWGAVIAFAAIFFGLLIPIVFGEEFHSLSPVIWIFMVGTTFTVPLLIGYSPFATAASAVYISFPLALTTAIANVLGNFILIPKWGLIGSAWATTISSVVSIITIVWMIKRRFRFEGFLLFQSMLPVTVGLIFFLILQDKWYASIIVFVLAVSFLVKNRDKFRESVNFARNVLIKKEFE
jgi:O-antigen/teichoic acid export membrane protein